MTSNRPDCLSHVGIAREIGVLFNRPFRIPSPHPPTTGAAVDTLASVTIESPELCPRFTARIIKGVKVGPSPWWMRKRLETLGVRPISNVVDVTNYVMFECGQPLHAYDFSKLEGQTLIPRRARKGETLKAINGKTYELTPEMLVIADAVKPVGLAGVMGGLDTEISSGTTDVLIEAARFDPLTIRKTSRALGLHSDSSYRFERPFDPEATAYASLRCTELILKTAGGSLHPGMIDAGSYTVERKPVTLRLDQIPRILGIVIEPAEVKRILLALGLEPRESEPATLTFIPPSWRSDLEREIDLIEEVARIHGYENIPEDRPVPLADAVKSPRERVEDATRSLLAGLGFNEAITLSFVPDELVGSMETDTQAQPIRVEHSVRKRANALRQSLIPSLLTSKAYNEAHGNLDVDLYEIANVYIPKPGQPLPDEPTRLTLVSDRDFLGLKGIVEAILARFHLEDQLVTRPRDLPWFTPGRSAELFLNDIPLGWMGEVSKLRRDQVELGPPCSAAELTLSTLVNHAVLVSRHQALPSLPAVSRDLSLVVPRSLPWADLAGVVAKAAGQNLESIVYLDSFRGGNITEDRQSLHFGLRFRHPERTLTGEEVEKAVQSIVKACSDRFEATLR